MTVIGLDAVKRIVELTVDGREVRVTEGSTILDACRRLGVETPTLCYGDTLTPVNVCRVCVVELEVLAELAQVMRDASICGLGQTAASAVRSAMMNLGVLAT